MEERLTKFKLARIGKGLTMTQVAKMTGVSLSYIHHIENGRREPTKQYLDLINPYTDSLWYDQIIKAVEQLCHNPDAILTSLRNALKFNKSRS